MCTTTTASSPALNTAGSDAGPDVPPRPPGSTPNTSSTMPSCHGSSSTGYDPVPPTTPATPGVSSLTDALAAGLQNLSQLGVNIGGGPVAPQGPEAPIPPVMSQESVRFPTVATDGPTALQHLDGVIRAQQGRLDRLRQRPDAASGMTEQQIRIGEQFAQQLDALRAKFTPLSSTIDRQEAGFIDDLVVRGYTEQGFDPAKLAIVVTRVQGTADGLSDRYIRDAVGAQVVAEGVTEQMAQLTRSSADQMNSGAAPDSSLLARIDQLAKLETRIQTALRANFDLAHTDQDAATRQLEDALRQSDRVSALATLGTGTAVTTSGRA